MEGSDRSVRQFFRPRLSASAALAGALTVQEGVAASATAAAQVAQPFQPLPSPTGQKPFRLQLDAVLGADAVTAIEQQGTLVFHTVGDTGGIKSPEPQEIVAMWMENEFTTGSPAPSFFYHLGDVVYFDGERNSYYDQFYEPYFHYAAPIFAIPGNHDGDLAIPPVGNSLDGFMINFCAPAPVVQPEAGDSARTAMTQPNCYWTLETPLATIVGLYTNCPEHGVVEQEQADWFVGELHDAPSDRALIVALHHPPYSADAHHGASLAMRELLQTSFTTSGRTPDLVLSGHVHNYQRFSVPTNGRSLPFIVAGAGGYPNLHYMGLVDGAPPTVPWTDPATQATLQAYNTEHRHGYLRLQVTRSEIQGVYTTVPRPQESWSHGPVTAIDTFSVPLAQSPP
jgi:hypothetical protein